MQSLSALVLLALVSVARAACDADCVAANNYLKTEKKSVKITGIDPARVRLIENSNNNFSYSKGLASLVLTGTWDGANNVYNVQVTGGAGVVASDSHAYAFKAKTQRDIEIAWPRTGLTKVRGTSCVQVTDGGIYDHITSVCEVKAVLDETADVDLTIKYPKNYEIMKSTRHDVSLALSSTLGTNNNAVEYTHWSEECAAIGGQVVSGTTTSDFCPTIKTIQPPTW